MRVYAYNINDKWPLHESAPLTHRRSLKKRVSITDPNNKAMYTPLKIRTETLRVLITQGVLVVEDLHGLDQQAKKGIRQWVLDSLVFKKR